MHKPFGPGVKSPSVCPTVRDAYHSTLGIQRVDRDGALVRIDPGEQHGSSQQELPTRMLSLGLVGNIRRCSYDVEIVDYH
jgi:hypothetical protein